MKKTTGLIALLVPLLLLGIYLGGAFYYKDKLLPHVYINDVAVGSMTFTDTNHALAHTEAWDHVTISSSTEDFLTMQADDINYNYVNSPELPALFDDQVTWQWPFAFFTRTDYTTPLIFDFNEEKVIEMIDGMEVFEQTLHNAFVAYDEEANAFIIHPSSYELKLTKQELYDRIVDAIKIGADTLNIDDVIEQPTLFADDEALVAARDQANHYLTMELIYDYGDREEVLDHRLLKELITVEGTEVKIDHEKTKAYVADLARTYDTFGRARAFTTSTGEAITVSGGSYGWATNRDQTTAALIEHIKNGENKTIEPIYSFTALIREANDLGDSYVEIDLDNQMVYLYIHGEQKVKTPTVTGDLAKGYETPTGVYPLNYKETDAILKGEDYASPVQYWMPFNHHVGMHDADWRTTFGGNIYETNGSHGCVNLPPEHAKTIFELVYPGIPVIVH